MKIFDCWVMGFVLKSNCKKKEDIRFSDGGVLPFFRSWNLGGLLLLHSKLFYCLQLPFKPILGEVTKICKDLDVRP